MALSQEFKESLEAILSREGKDSPMTIFQNGMKLMKAHQISYEQHVHPSQTLTHTENRSGLMLDCTKVHNNIISIFKGGADIKQLTNSYAFELGPESSLRKQHLEANAKLIAESNGWLAPINGSERYVTVGCGHTVAGCKAVWCGSCKTDVEELKDPADEEGKLNRGYLEKSSVYKSMINDGWTWTIIPSSVDEQYPQFANIAQQALNVSNHIATEMSELEVAIILAKFVETGKEDKAVNHIQNLGAPSAPYAETMLVFVKEYGGGAGAPHLKFADSVAKSFHISTKISCKTWKTCTASDSTNHYSQALS